MDAVDREKGGKKREERKRKAKTRDGALKEEERKKRANFRGIVGIRNQGHTAR